MIIPKEKILYSILQAKYKKDHRVSHCKNNYLKNKSQTIIPPFYEELLKSKHKKTIDYVDASSACETEKTVHTNREEANERDGYNRKQCRRQRRRTSCCASERKHRSSEVYDRDGGEEKDREESEIAEATFAELVLVTSVLCNFVKIMTV